MAASVGTCLEGLWHSQNGTERVLTEGVFLFWSQTVLYYSTRIFIFRHSCLLIYLQWNALSVSDPMLYLDM